MKNNYTITEDFQHELQKFLTSHDIALLNQDLRRQFIDYLDYVLDSGVPLYFDSFLFPFNSLLDLLHKAANELNDYESAKKIHAQTLTTNISTNEKVMAFIKDTLNPEKVFMLHHETGADEIEYFDLLVVIPETSQTYFNNYEQVISMANIENAAIHVSLHKSATIQKQLEDGHIYYMIACSKKNLVYDDGNTSLPETNSDVLKTLAEKARNEFNVSHKKAESFLQGASNYYGDNDKEMATFMLQQAVELTLRGFITALLGSCPKTHCFGELKKPLKRCAPELHYLFSENKEEESRLLHILEKAYLEARYTSKFTVSDNDFKLLIEGAENLHAKAEALFKEKIHSLLPAFKFMFRRNTKVIKKLLTIRQQLLT